MICTWIIASCYANFLVFKMKFSIITVCRNSEKTIFKTIDSVNKQKNVELEHVFIDGSSTDNTVKLIDRTSSVPHFVKSQKDNGIYDAMNKGLNLASGEIVGFINSDDWYSDDSVLEDVEAAFSKFNVDFVYGDLLLFLNEQEISHYWKASSNCETVLKGAQIPHPTFFVKRTVLEKLTPSFDDQLKVAADLKQQLILINKMGCKGKYLNRELACMMLGGKSTNGLKSYLFGWKESIDAYNDVFYSGGLKFTILKVFKKLPFIFKKKKIKILKNRINI